jgi:secondary thiamine-phosphate synthase enzyme
MHTLHVPTRKRVEFIDITSEVAEKVKDISGGICVVYCPHTTAGLTINENADPSVQKDIIGHLGELVPADKRYEHLEGNADAHIKTSLVGSSLQIIIEKGHLVLGTWQGIYFCEFDGPRSRNIYIQIIKE